MVDVSARRSQIASLISSDLEAKRELKKRTTAADLLKAKMNIGGRKEVANIRRGGAMEREQIGQRGATFRQNIAVAGDKAVQAMRGKQALGVQSLRNVGGARVQDIKGEQAEELLGTQIDASRWAAEEENFRAQAQTRSTLATIPAMDISDYVYNPTTTGKKKKTATEDYLLIP